ncbi:MAG: dethiobiotin synthase [Cohaesibacter sp.]|jgi:dethiobiotin synthetase|nr:dethiobiotin synthase [Cohaesibacter sp.]
MILHHSPLAVLGTDTGIGKTIFSAALVGALGASYWKPVQSGLEEETDSSIVARLSGVPSDNILEEGWRLSAPLSPHRSAELDGVEIHCASLTPPQTQGPLIIEGAGGLMVPLTRQVLLIDQVARWGCPVVLCARTGLGTINHTLLSLEALRHRGVRVIGVAFIGEENDDNMRTIGDFAQVKVLGRLPVLSQLDPQSLKEAFASHFDIADFQSNPD